MGSEMTQALYAYMNKRKNLKKECSPQLCHAQRKGPTSEE
jgi:hypothetical protein